MSPQRQAASVLRLLLVPDASAARRGRRLIAERGACSGIVVGTWPELVELARRAYLLAAPAEDWERVFAHALGELKDAFWAESRAVAPVETAETVARALVAVLAATDPARGFEGLSYEDLAARPRRHVEDIVRLTSALDGRLPPELEAIRELLAADPRDALRPLKAIAAPGVPALTRWQAALVAKLNAEAAASGDDGDDAILEAFLERVLTEPAVATAQGALGVLQTRLYRPTMGKVVLDRSVQWLGVRDFLQEAEVAAGMVQAQLRADQTFHARRDRSVSGGAGEYAVRRRTFRGGCRP